MTRDSLPNAGKVWKDIDIFDMIRQSTWAVSTFGIHGCHGCHGSPHLSFGKAKKMCRHPQLNLSRPQLEGLPRRIEDQCLNLREIGNQLLGFGKFSFVVCDDCIKAISLRGFAGCLFVLKLINSFMLAHSLAKMIVRYCQSIARGLEIEVKCTFNVAPEAAVVAGRGDGTIREKGTPR